MSEIKFKGKTARSGKWVHGFYANTNGVAMIMDEIELSNADCFMGTVEFTFYRIIPETVCRFTGLPDKNGDELYECDIIEHNNTLYVIEYSENNVGFICIDRKHKTRSGFPNWRDGSWLYNVHKYVKRIGNIHDKSELQEAGE